MIDEVQGRHKEAQLMLTNPRDAFRGQSRSPNMVPFDILGMVSYAIVTLSLRLAVIRLRKMSWPWNLGQRSLEVIGTDTDRSATYDFLLTLHSNQKPISYRFRDKRRFQSKIANFSYPMYLRPPLKGFPWYWRKGSKTRMMGLPGGQKRFKIGLAV